MSQAVIAGSRGRRERFLAGALFTTVFAVYFGTSSAHLTGGDNAEFVTIFAAGGVAHPSGYPLYCILLRLLAWMPGGAVLGSSRVSAFLGALSVVALYRACRAWGGSPPASLVAVAAYASAPLAWRLATEAEVFALHALFAALLLYAAAPGIALSPPKRAILLAGLGGLALSNHLTIVLLAPIGLIATLRSILESRSRARTAVAACVSFGAGLLPYLYCYEVGRAPDGRYVWGEPGTWTGLVRHILRADYGTLQLTGADESPHLLSNVALFFTQSARDALVVPFLVGLFGFGWVLAAVSRDEKRCALGAGGRRDVLALLATWALAGPVFAAFLNVPPNEGGATLVERFDLLPAVVLTIGAAWGLDAWRALRESRAFPLAFAAIAIAAAAAVFSWPAVREEHTDALELYTENTLRTAPPRAILLGTGDYRLFSFLYEGAIERRPDVAYIDPHLLGYEWYRQRAGGALGAPISPEEDALALAQHALSVGRPVLLTDVFDPRVVKALPSYPLGTLIRLLPPGAPMPPPEEVERENVAVFAQFQRWEVIAREDQWAKAVLPTYQRPWIALARMFERRGDQTEAKVNRGRGGEWGGGAP